MQTFMILFGGLMAVGLVAVGILIKRLDIRGARRATAALTAEPSLEDELQAIIEANEQKPRAR